MSPVRMCTKETAQYKYISEQKDDGDDVRLRGATAVTVNTLQSSMFTVLLQKQHQQQHQATAPGSSTSARPLSEYSTNQGSLACVSGLWVLLSTHGLVGLRSFVVLAQGA